MHNGDFPQWMGRLSYLVNIIATDELAIRGARASATMELVHFSWIIPFPATYFFSMCMPVQFSINTVCIETCMRPLLFSWLQIICIILSHIYWLSDISIIIPHAQCSCWGVYWFHSVRLSVCPSVRPTSRVRSVAPSVLVGSISYLYVLSSSFRCRVWSCLQNCKIWIFWQFF